METLSESAAATPPIHHSFLWMLAGSGAFSLSQWARIAILAKMSSPAVVGAYVLALSLVTPIFNFTNVQLNAVQTTDARNRYRFADFAALRLLTSSIALVVVGALTFVLRWDQTLTVILAFTLAADSLCEIFGSLQQKNERIDRLSISLLLRALLSISAFALVFHQTRSLAAAVATIPAATLIVLFAWDIPMGKRMLGGAPLLSWDFRQMRSLALFSLPLGIIMMLMSLNVNVPRYALMHDSGTGELGIFASLSYIIMAVNLLVGGLGHSVSARLSRYYAAGEVRKFRSLSRRLCGIGLLLGTCCLTVAALIGRWLLTILYRPEYAAHLDVFLVLATTSGISAAAAFLGFGITAAHAFRRQVWTHLAAVTTTSIGSLILVPRYHAVGAALSLLIAALVQITLAATILHRALRCAES